MEARGASLAAGVWAPGVWAPAIDQNAAYEIQASLDLIFMGYFLSVAKNATVLPMDPPGVETGTSTSSRCSPLEPQGMDCTKVCADDPSVAPSMVMACEEAASRRDMVTSTLEAGELPGQSTLNANRVEITNDLLRFWLVSPGFEVPLK